MEIALTVYVLAAAFVIRAAYCRLSKTSKRTDPHVRANFVLAAAGQIVGIVALILGSANKITQADALAIGLTAVTVSSAIGFWLSSHRWRGGPPPTVQRDEVPTVFPWERREVSRGEQ